MRESRREGKTERTTGLLLMLSMHMLNSTSYGEEHGTPVMRGLSLINPCSLCSTPPVIPCLDSNHDGRARKKTEDFFCNYLYL